MGSEEERKMQLFKETVRKLWNEWEIRVLVLLSLCLQIILILLGKRRKYTARAWVRAVLWLAYLSADWVATLALGVYCHKQGDISSASDGALVAFWAPFLLVHLGGPDTITAYSLEDNELWLRHFLGLLVQTGIAFYVFLRSWTSPASPLTLLAIPMFVSGIIKYGERTWVLYSASYDQFGNYLQSGDDWKNLVIQRQSSAPPGTDTRTSQDLERLADEPDHFRNYLQSVNLDKLLSERSADSNKDLESLADEGDAGARQVEAPSEAKIYHDAYLSFKIFKRLYSDLIFSKTDIQKSQRFILQSPWQVVFKVIELELGFLYDVLFTKAPVFFSATGISLRFISFASTASAFVGFLIIEKQGFSRVDVDISYALMAGAVVLEIYAVVIMLASDWTIAWLASKRAQHCSPIFESTASLCFAIKSISAGHRWSDSMAQLSLIDYCKRNKPSKLQDCFTFCKTLQRRRHMRHKKVPACVKEAIFRRVVEIFIQRLVKMGEQGDRAEADGSSRRVMTLLISLLPEEIRESALEMDFDEKLIVWHIATYLCYHSDADQLDPDREVSKLISDYMFYLLVLRTSMLPKGYGKVRLELTFKQAATVLQTTDPQASRLLDSLRKRQAELFRTPVQEEVSMLPFGLELAKVVQSEGLQGELQRELGLGKWEALCKLWTGKLCFAANRCEWKEHAQQLGKGGELLTHVNLLLTHLGMTDQTRNITSPKDEEIEFRRAIDHNRELRGMLDRIRCKILKHMASVSVINVSMFDSE